MTPERGFAARWLRLFPFPLKIHFKGRQLPAGWGLSQIFFCRCNAENRILATGGAENFSFRSPHHRVLKFAKRNGNFLFASYYGQKSKMPNAGAKKFPSHLLLPSEQGKMAGNGAEQQKSSKSFSDLLLSLASGGRLIFCFRAYWSKRNLNNAAISFCFTYSSTSALTFPCTLEQ